MAKELPPYVNSTGLLQELFKKIQEAPPPSRFSQDFLFTNLKFKKSGSTIPFIPFLKRIGFLSTDGSPTEVYKKFRNPDTKISGQAMAQAFKVAYSDLYNRNEYWHTKSSEDLKNFLVEVLEVEKNNPTLTVLIRTIETLKKMANFEVPVDTEEENEVEEQETERQPNSNSNNGQSNPKSSDLAGINLSYTINLNLPETSDGKVFDAIFKSLKENLLKK
ncbi:MAG: hypothetical protein DI539_17520 [Flavobacterium psychrophilum]|nr:MAG: hypothetical protein DI539_17520 [Flavobacterium psychrophilum]